MDDMTAFERQVARRFRHHAGPIHTVDDGAIFTAPLVVAQPFGRQASDVPGAATDEAAPKAAVVSGRFESVSRDVGSLKEHGVSPDGLLVSYRGQTFAVRPR